MLIGHFIKWNPPFESPSIRSNPSADELPYLYAFVWKRKRIVSIFQVILQEKYHLLNTFSRRLDPICFSPQFVPLSKDLCPNSTSLAHFLHRYCSVLRCIYTRFAANQFLVETGFFPNYRDILVSFFLLAFQWKSGDPLKRGGFISASQIPGLLFIFRFSIAWGIFFPNTYIIQNCEFLNTFIFKIQLSDEL